MTAGVCRCEPRLDGRTKAWIERASKRPCSREGILDSRKIALIEPPICNREDGVNQGNKGPFPIHNPIHKGEVLDDLPGFRRSPRVCKSLKNRDAERCHGRGRQQWPNLLISRLLQLRTVLSTTRFPEAVRPSVPDQWPYCELSELRRILRRIVRLRGSDRSCSLLCTPLKTCVLRA